MASIEGVIVLSSSNEPVITLLLTQSQANVLVDHFAKRLEEVKGDSENSARRRQRTRTGYRFRIPLQSSDKLLPVIPGELVQANYPEDVVEDEESQSSVGAEEDDCDKGSFDADFETGSSIFTNIVHIEHNQLRLLAVTSQRSSTTLAIVFLQAVLSIMEKYLGSPLTEEAIRENFDVVYQLLEEMLDESGQPLHTEYNTLRELVREPSWIDDIVSRLGAASGLSNAALGNAMSAPQLPAIPWRRPMSKTSRSTRNEAYFDCVETLRGVFARGREPRGIGRISIHVRIDGTCNLSGMPDVLLRLSEAHRHIVDASLHPCVRLRSWKNERILSFAPPDGQFTLADFDMQSSKALERHVPLKVEASRRGGDKEEETSFSIVLSCSQIIENIEILFSIGDKTSTVETTTYGGTRPSVASEDTNALRGTFQYNAKTGVARWQVHRLSPQQRPLEMKGLIRGEHDARLSTAITSRFEVMNLSLTGLRVSQVDIHDVQNRPQKGVRSIVRGDLDWRW